MAEQKQPDPSNAGSIAQQIVTILIKEDSETRSRAIQAALMLLGESSIASPKRQSHEQQPNLDDNDQTEIATFFDRDEKLKPADSAYLCAAYHYSLHGAAAFSLDDLRAIASEAGVVLPDRLDMTLKQAGKAGKKLFQSAGRDAYRPTASAGLLFKERWGVKPGKKSKLIAKE